MVNHNLSGKMVIKKKKKIPYAEMLAQKKWLRDNPQDKGWRTCGSCKFENFVRINPEMSCGNCKTPL